MRVLVAGADGGIGGQVARRWAERGDEVIALGRRRLDVAAEPDVWAAIRDHDPDVVVNCSGVVGEHACRADPERAWRVNTGGPEHLAQACRAAGALLMLLSGPEVFDGHLDRPYDEFDPVSPVSLFGRTKAAGEQVARLSGAEFQVVRSSWVIGAGGDDLVGAVLAAAREGGPLPEVGDEEGHPTFVTDLADAMRELAVRRRVGFFHATGRGTCTRTELAEAALEAAGLRVGRFTTSPPTAGTGRNRRLEGRHAALIGLDPLPYWRDALGRLPLRA